MKKMIKYWLTGCTARIGNTIYKKASKALEKGIVGCLLTLVLTFLAGSLTYSQMYPLESFFELILLCVFFVLELLALVVMMVFLENKLLTAVISKEAKKEAEEETARRQREEWERARREQAEWEKAQREWAAEERARRERAEREKARREQAEREKARRQKAEQNAPVQKARQLLRLREAYTISDLKRARNTLIKEFHPDNKISGNEEMCKKINEAYALLSKYAKTA